MSKDSPWAKLPPEELRKIESALALMSALDQASPTFNQITTDSTLRSMDAILYHTYKQRSSSLKSPQNTGIVCDEREKIALKSDQLAIKRVDQINQLISESRSQHNYSSMSNKFSSKNAQLSNTGVNFTQDKVSRFLPVNPFGIVTAQSKPSSPDREDLDMMVDEILNPKDELKPTILPKSTKISKSTKYDSKADLKPDSKSSIHSTSLNNGNSSNNHISSNPFQKKPKQIVYGKTSSSTSDTNGIDEEDSDISLTSSHNPPKNAFQTAYSKYGEEQAKNGLPPLPPPSSNKSKKRNKPDFLDDNSDSDEPASKRASKSNSTNSTKKSEISANSVVKKISGGDNKTGNKPVEEEEFKGVDPEIAERVLKEILDVNLNVKWSDIAGLEDVKQILREMIILPNLHPEMFTGLRAPPRGLLLFGPPGNGKTMIAKAIATEAGLTFFSISASVLCSKWIGEGEKTMRALFAIARAKAPSFIFIDEVDSILCSRSSEEHESSRRLKNEFLLQFDGATTSTEDAVTVMGATNRPFDLDDAARRRLPKRIYVPLPEKATRVNLLKNLLKGEPHSLSFADIDDVAEKLQGYSCSDIHQISQTAAMGPVRDRLKEQMKNANLKMGELRPITTQDFQNAIETTRPSVAPEECKLYEDFSEKFGTKGL